MGGSVTFWFFFQGDPWGSDRSTDRHAKWLKQRGFKQGCAFWSKNWKFLYPLALSPRKPLKFGPFWSGLGKYSLDFALALEVSLVNTHKSSLEPPKSIIVNMQCGGGKSKYGVRPRNAKIVTQLYLDANISKTVWDRGWYQLPINRKRPMADRMMTSPMTSRDPERSRSWPQYL